MARKRLISNVLRQAEGVENRRECRDDDAPVLWSEWPAEGLLLQTEVFGHIPGVADVQTGIEPLFAWVRLATAYEQVIPVIRLKEQQ